jgi:23S rRNA (cytidine1920-2'-O)/16S rRNA (cytidine1409-2'-O)-methyltransferase
VAETGRVRADQLLVDRGLAGSRTEATRLILAGRVRLGVATLDKAGRLLRAGDALSVSAAPPFVGRGGEKLAAALVAFDVRPSGRVCLDVGASTGGFTDCLLQAGARHVYAVDVGRGQLHARLRADARVTVLEGTNARYLDRTRLPETPDLVTVDVAFISLDKVLPAIVASVAAGAEVVALVKPQFEVGRGQVGKGGVVRDARQHREVVLRVAGAARALDLATAGVTASPLLGPRGNREFFLHLCRGAAGLSPDALAAAVDAATGSGERR